MKKWKWGNTKTRPVFWCKVYLKAPYYKEETCHCYSNDFHPSSCCSCTPQHDRLKMKELCIWVALTQLSGEKLISGLTWFSVKWNSKAHQRKKIWIIGYPLHIKEGRSETIGHSCSYLGWESVWRVSKGGTLKSHRKKKELSDQVSNKMANHTACERDTRMWKAVAEGCSQNHSWSLWDLDRENRY